MKTLFRLLPFSFLILFFEATQAGAQKPDYSVQEVRFESQGVLLAGSLLLPAKPWAAVVLVHGSDPVKRELEFARRLAKEGLAVLTYDKRGVGESGGVYVGPSVGTNNLDTANLALLAHDANAALRTCQSHLKDKSIRLGLVGFSQAGWIIPMAASHNPMVRFMVIFSGPTITTLEQLRFQFYTNGDAHFWEKHTEAEAREHTLHDPDKYHFTGTDPKDFLQTLTIPGLWLFGRKDIQIPALMCLDQLNTLKSKGKPIEYALFPQLGHNTAFDTDASPVETAVRWMKDHASAKR